MGSNGHWQARAAGMIPIQLRVKGGRFPMKLALYLPNFRDKVTVSEIVDLARVAEEIEFDSIWTLDRIVVPEASDRQELRKPFGFMKEFPRALPVASRGEWLQGLPLIPYLAGITKKITVGVSVIDTPYRAPGVLAAEIATWDHLSGGRVNVGVGTGWMPEEFEAASAAHIYEKRRVRLVSEMWLRRKAGSEASSADLFRGPRGTEDRGEASR
jgi:alkanesulfonate monooxygenase SsuD/methylene tetrahydromethanopterin reductase-like flavin-dependent oxidoreductase (luciferase family)